MFKKLVSSLPFNPSLLSEVSFYAKRLHQEESLRRAGFVFMAMAMIVQVFAFIYPPQSTLANSPSDIVYGATSKSQIVSALQNNRDALGRTDIQNIYNYYGVTLADVQAATSVTVKSRERQYVTTGRSQSPGVDTLVAIPGATTSVYERSLNVWDIRNYENTYPAITGVATGNGLLKGKRFWILLKGCGNITFEEIPKNPKLEIQKKKVTQGTLKPGDTLEYKIFVRNTGNAAAKDVKIVDSLPSELEYLSYTANGKDPVASFTHSNQTLTWTYSALSPTTDYQYLTLRTKVRAIDSKKTVCNSATISASNHGSLKTINSDSERCATVEQPTCPGTNLPIPSGGVEACTVMCEDGSEIPYNDPNGCPDTAQQNLTCESLRITDRQTWQTYTFQTRILAQADAEVAAVEYYVDSQLVHTSDVAFDAVVDEYTHTFNEGSHTIRASIVAQKGTVQATSTCELTLEIEKPKELTPLPIRNKTVIFTSTGDDANGKTAQAGDELAFSVTVTNEGDAVAPNETFTDDIKDILEYADLTDNGGGQYDGLGQTISWEPTDIEPGQSVTKTFKVRVKNPIPTTPVSASDPLSYDNVIENYFGNRVEVRLPVSTTKQVENTLGTLPNTGPGTTMLVSSLGFVIVGYFFFRTRLLAKELDIIKADEIAGGI